MADEQKQVHNPHDTGYRYLFKSKKAFLQLIRSFIKHDWVQDVDETSLIYVDRSYILQDFQEKEADVVYQARLKDRDIIFYVLMELQSTVDFLVPYRLLLYMQEIWRDILKNTPENETKKKGFRLPLIVPMLLYNGSDRWTVPLTFRETLSSYEDFGEMAVNFRYHLFNVRSYDEAELLELSNLISVVFKLDSTDSIEEILTAIVEFTDVIKGLTKEEFKLFTDWTKQILAGNLPEKDKEKLSQVLDEARLEEVELMITNVERVIKKSLDDAKKEGFDEGRDEGFDEGRDEGRAMVAKQMLAEGFEIDAIIRCTGLTKEELEKLSQQH